jgi:hypothetical protein
MVIPLENRGDMECNDSRKMWRTHEDFRFLKHRGNETGWIVLGQFSTTYSFGKFD